MSLSLGLSDIFLRVRLELWAFGEGSALLITSHHGHMISPWLGPGHVTLDGLVKVVATRFLHSPVSLAPFSCSAACQSSSLPREGE